MAMCTKEFETKNHNNTLGEDIPLFKLRFPKFPTATHVDFTRDQGLKDPGSCSRLCLVMSKKGRI